MPNIASASSISSPRKSAVQYSTTSPFSEPTKKVVSIISKLIQTVYGFPEVSDKEGLAFDDNPEFLDKYISGYDKILTMIPGDMQYQSTSSILNAWDFNPQITEFNKLLASVLSHAGITPHQIPAQGVKFYCTEISMTDALSNQYGENVLNSVNNLIPQLVSDYAYMSNGSLDTFKHMLTDNLKAMVGDDFTSTLIGGLSNVTDSTQKILGKLGVKNLHIPNSGVLHDLLSGYKIDLPKIWKNSTSTKQLQVKIQLTSAIDNTDALIQRIVIPYAILLVLSSPRSSKSYLYKWPFVIKAKLPGYANFKLSAISDVQITKGGIDGIRSYDGKYLAIDLTVTLVPLYNTQFAVDGTSLPSTMLTVSDELSMLQEYFTKERTVLT